MGEYAMWLVALSLLVALRILMARPRFRSLVGAAARDLGARAAERLNPPDERDELADELRRVIRREQLRADVRRLERILATDMSMSATRQIANRMAYAWLLDESDRQRRETSMILPDESEQLWNVPGQSRMTRKFAASQYAPQVEVLEISWKT